MSELSDRGLYWANALSKQRASGLSAAEWCRNEGVSFNSFAGWRTRLNKEAKVDGGWISVKDAQPSGRPLTLRIGAAQLDLSPGFDPQLLREVIAALSPRC